MSLNRILAVLVFIAVLGLLPWALSDGVGAAETGKREAASSDASPVTPMNSMAASLRARGLDRAPGLGRMAGAQRLPIQVTEDQLAAQFETIAVDRGEQVSLIVKFRDHVAARPIVANDLVSIQSRTGADMTAFQQIVAGNGLSVAPAFSKPIARLEQMQALALQRSGRPQPDIAGMVRITGPNAQMLQVARQLNALNVVEFVEFENILDPTRSEAFGLVDPIERRPRPDAERQAQPGPAPDPPRRPDPVPTIPHHQVDVSVDSGIVTADAARFALRPDAEPQFVEVFSDVVSVRDAPWIQLRFREVTLNGSVEDGTGAYLRIMSLFDGDTQILDAREMARWRTRSAIFRGEAVHIGLYVHPDAPGASRVIIEQAVAGEPVEGGIGLSACDGEDNRQLAFDPEVETCTDSSCVTGRLWPVGCTAFVFRDDEDFADNKFWLLTAGHCVTGGGLDVVHFNVPLSDADGTPQPPPVVDQFPLESLLIMDTQQVMDQCNGLSCFNDWAILRIEGDGNDPNPVDQYQAADYVYRMATEMPDLDDGDVEVRIRGYGNTFETPAPLEWNSVLKDAFGPIVNVISSDGIDFRLAYRADSTGGDSGAPVIRTDTGELIAIHTCGGCAEVGGANLGTAIVHAGLRHGLNAAANDDLDDPNFFNKGACCIQGNCFHTNDEVCAANNGFFAGVGTQCGDWGCQAIVCCWTSVFGPVCSHTSEWGCRSVCGQVIGTFIPDVFECDEPGTPGEDEPCDEDPDCGEPTAGSCFYANYTPGCDNEDLCEDVCNIDPVCCDDAPGDWVAIGRPGGWDEICAWHAWRLGGFEHICFGTIGSCYDENSTIGCDDPGCCLSVCMIDPYCCEHPFRWDSVCAEIAESICPQLDPTGPTPDLSIAQGYLTFESYLEQHGFVPSFVAASLIPDTAPSSALTHRDVYPREFRPLELLFAGGPPAGWGGEGFDLQGLWEYAEKLDTGVENMTRGLGTRIGVLYPSAFVQPTGDSPSTDNDQTHEDLRGRVWYPELDQTQIIIPNSPTGFLNGHAGTAILGIIAANPDNDLGMTGMSPDADVYYFPTVSVEQGGRVLNALANAIEMFDAGDVILLPYTPRAATLSYASTATANTLFALASSLGISTVIAAGDVDGVVAAQAGEEDSGVLIVGAVTPGLPFFRAGFSRHCSAGAGDPCEELEAVHNSGWGHAVATLGFGDLYLGETDGEPDPLRSYTSSFGGGQLPYDFDEEFPLRPDDTGTGAAAAQVAAALANLSGIPKMFYGMPLTPFQLRGEYCGNAWPQAGYGLGSAGPPGTASEAPAFYGDWDFDADPKNVGSIEWPSGIPGINLLSIGVISDLPLAAEWIVIGGFFDDCDDLKAAHTIRGQHISGNLFALCQQDAVYFTIRSEPTNVSNGPSFVPPSYEGPMGNVVYRATGQVADAFAVFGAPSGIITTLGARVYYAALGVPGFVFIEMYDWQQSRWQVVGVAFDDGTADGCIVPEDHPDVDDLGCTPAPNVYFFNPGRFVNNNTQEILVRTWAFGFQTPPGPNGVPDQIPFEYRVDMLSLDVASFGADPDGD